MEELVSMVITNKDQLLPKSKIILRLISKVPGRYSNLLFSLLFHLSALLRIIRQQLSL